MCPDMLLAATEALPADPAETPPCLVLVGYGTQTELARYASDPDWTVHVPGHPDEARHAVVNAVTRGVQTYIHTSPHSNSAAHALTGGFTLIREGREGVVLAVGTTLDPVLRATAHTDLAVLYTATIRPFDEIGLRTAVLAADHADVVLVEPGSPGTSADHVARTLVHVPHRLLSLGEAEGLDEHKIAHAVRGFVR